jgi:hypothetical protein
LGSRGLLGGYVLPFVREKEPMGRIEWLPITEVSAPLRDGRDVLLWVDRRATVGYWDRYLDGEDWATHEQTRPKPSHFAELNNPE